MGAEDISYWDKALEILNGTSSIVGISELGAIDSWPYTMNDDPIVAFNRNGNTPASEVIWEAVYDENQSGGPKDATLLTWNKYSAFNTDSLPYISNIDIANSIIKANRCTWHVFSMSAATSYFIRWLDASAITNTLPYYSLPLPTVQAQDDKRYKQLYQLMQVADTNGNPYSTELYDTKFPNVLRPNIWCNKFFRAKNGQYSTLPVIRIPELYLTRAILKVKTTGNTFAGSSDIEKIQIARGLTVTSPGMLNETEVEREWIRELAFEGHRLRFLMALKKDIPAGDRAVSSIAWPYNSIISNGSMWQIPLNETDFKN